MAFRAVHTVDDRGQAVAFVIAVAGLALTVTMALVGLAGHVVDSARASRAADAAALAGVTGGSSAAARLAAVNDATLVAFVRTGETVTVTVRVGSAEADARASTAETP